MIGCGSAFETISGEVVNVILAYPMRLAAQDRLPIHRLRGIDAGAIMFGYGQGK